MKNIFLIALLCLLINLPAFADSQYEQLERLGRSAPQRLKNLDKNNEIARIELQEKRIKQEAESRAWAETHQYEPHASSEIMNVFIMGPGTSKTWGTAYIY